MPKTPKYRCFQCNKPSARPGLHPGCEGRNQRLAEAMIRRVGEVAKRLKESEEAKQAETKPEA